ncbi:type III secretion system export apparatus subunit SctR [Thalassococcus sp. S3]|uniref:type III secretion system export apparatus subunit SctR n=1 Tax=Thalassococcus sp. S3 TaxID=2017482 RepID=UPI001024504B|nr:type III secretion system export apparatus subunit SctR [Thalassococcus sp. S3]QBF33405.1 EscR/YscR/HrcR family type III secretion system export apparatus protein [Thalassococcus sp. S3]
MGDQGPTILTMLTILLGLGMMPFVVLATTSFVKVAVVLFILRSALGVQQTPPNIVLYTIALALTGFVGAPVASAMITEIQAGGTDFTSFDTWVAAFQRAQVPLRDFMMALTTEQERAFFVSAAQQAWPADADLSAAPDQLVILVPSFLMAELRRAFEIGFLIYLPFVTVDLIVTTILMAMGMSQVTPSIISTPFKLFLFVSVEGWTLILTGLLTSYAGAQ